MILFGLASLIAGGKYPAYKACRYPAYSVSRHRSLTHRIPGRKVWPAPQAPRTGRVDLRARRRAFEWARASRSLFRARWDGEIFPRVGHVRETLCMRRCHSTSSGSCIREVEGGSGAYPAGGAGALQRKRSGPLADFHAAFSCGQNFARVQAAFGIEEIFQVLHAVERIVGEEMRHHLVFLHADAVLGERKISISFRDGRLWRFFVRTTETEFEFGRDTATNAPELIIYNAGGGTIRCPRV